MNNNNKNCDQKHSFENKNRRHFRKKKFVMYLSFSKIIIIIKIQIIEWLTNCNFFYFFPFFFFCELIFDQNMNELVKEKKPQTLFFLSKTMTTIFTLIYPRPTNGCRYRTKINAPFFFLILFLLINLTNREKKTAANLFMNVKCLICRPFCPFFFYILLII